jgi:two-component system cell cycle response regulator DivK
MSKRILVVEDQEDLRAILRAFLSASGYSVIEAVDGAESVAKAASERPDLVLMDIQLPVLDGYDATRQIKALPGFAAIPIIAVSSIAMKGDEEKARASGCDDYVTKPYSPIDLLAVYGAISGRRHSTNLRIVGRRSGRNVCGRRHACEARRHVRRGRDQRAQRFDLRCSSPRQPHRGREVTPLTAQ